MKNCRICEYDFNDRSHCKFTEEFYCAVCEQRTEASYHNSNKYFGMAIECISCHNYIKYITPSSFTIWKDELYIDNLCLVRNYEEKLTYLIGESDKTICSIEGIMIINSIASLKNKIKTMKVFS